MQSFVPWLVLVNKGWDVDPIANDLVSMLVEHRAEIDAELCAMARAGAA